MYASGARNIARLSGYLLLSSMCTSEDHMARERFKIKLLTLLCGLVNSQKVLSICHSTCFLFMKISFWLFWGTFRATISMKILPLHSTPKITKKGFYFKQHFCEQFYVIFCYTDVAHRLHNITLNFADVCGLTLSVSQKAWILGINTRSRLSEINQALTHSNTLSLQNEHKMECSNIQK